MTDQQEKRALPIYIPPDADDDVFEFLQLTSNELRALRRLQTDHKSLGISLNDRFRIFAAAASIPMVKARASVLVYDYLVKEQQKAGAQPKAVVAALEEFVKAIYESATQKILLERLNSQHSSLLALFDLSKDELLTSKAQEMSKGPGRRATKVWTVCDLRPVFDAESDGGLEPGEIQGYVRVTTLLLRTLDLAGDSEVLAVSLTPAMLSKLQETVQRARSKIDVMGRQQNIRVLDL